MEIQYVVGDATRPIGSGAKVIAHICNDVGAWGAGFVLALSKRWKEPEQYYRQRFRGLGRPGLGDVQFVNVEPGIYVANMIAQHKYGIKKDHPPPIRYEALAECLSKVKTFATCDHPICSIHMPRIGCGLAGGTWGKIEPIIQQELDGLSVTVYDLKVTRITTDLHLCYF